MSWSGGRSSSPEQGLLPRPRGKCAFCHSGPGGRELGREGRVDSMKIDCHMDYLILVNNSPHSLLPEERDERMFSNADPLHFP